jgi:hypothetical protein
VEKAQAPGVMRGQVIDASPHGKLHFLRRFSKCVFVGLQSGHVTIPVLWLQKTNAARAVDVMRLG